MDASRDDRDRVASSASGERPVNPDGLTEQPLSPTKDGRIVSANSSDAAIVGPSRNVTGQPDFLDAGGSAYGSSTGTWNGYSQYLNADGLPVVSPFIYNDNQSLVFHSGYGFNPEIAYGQYSPVATPLPPLMMDGQLYSPQQLPFSTSFYPQSAPPNMAHISSAFQVPPTELMTPESSNIDNMFFGPGSGYLVNFGSLGGGNLSGNLNSSPLTSPTVYPQPMGILGPYENNFGQISQQHNPTHGFGLMSGPHYPHTSQNSSFGGASFSYSVASDMNQLTLDKGRRRDRDQDSISVSNDSRDIFNDRNRGPRASKLKGKSGTEQGSSTGASRNDSSASGILLDAYNRPDFVTDYENAKFFIIKSFSEDNVHKSIKYNIWASTPHGNKKLDAAYQEAKEIQPNCPIFLFFSVNASGQFCGVAEMVGPVDFEKNADYWQQDRWNGQFPVKWHIVKDVPNIRFRHILLDNNDNKPVTHSRDSQEVGLKQGVEMLKIFKDHDSRTSMLDDFTFYDDREKSFKERKAKQQQVLSTVDAAQVLSTVDAANKLVHEMSSTFGLTLNLKDGSDKAGSSELSVNSRKDTQASFEHESLNQMSGTLSQGSGAEEGDKVVASVLGEESVDKEATV